MGKLEKIKSGARKVFYYVGIGFAVISALIVCGFLYKFLKSRGQKIVLHPKISIVDIKYKESVPDKSVLESAVRGAKEATERMKAIRDGK